MMTKIWATLCLFFFYLIPVPIDVKNWIKDDKRLRKDKSVARKPCAKSRGGLAILCVCVIHDANNHIIPHEVFSKTSTSSIKEVKKSENLSVCGVCVSNPPPGLQLQATPCLTICNSPLKVENRRQWRSALFWLMYLVNLKTQRVNQKQTLCARWVNTCARSCWMQALAAILGDEQRAISMAGAGM